MKNHLIIPYLFDIISIISLSTNNIGKQRIHKLLNYPLN